MKKFLPALIILFCLLLSHSVHAQKTPVVYRFNIIQNTDSTYGYDILKNNKIFIHQPFKPAVPGNKGFVKKISAQKIAQLVIKKLKNNIVPPSVSTKKLENLRAY